MARLARRALLFVAFSLLILAATVYAECAWALWGVTYEKTRDSIRSESEARAFGGKAPEPHYDEVWQPASAHETRQACFDHMGTAKMFLPYVKYFKCLPDTVDPRGPKGK